MTQEEQSAEEPREEITSWKEEPIHPRKKKKSWVKKGSGAKGILLVVAVAAALVVSVVFVGVLAEDGIGRSFTGSESQTERETVKGWDKDLSEVQAEAEEAGEVETIVATHPDTSSKLGLDVEFAFMGTNWEGDTYVVLSGTFTNGADEAVSLGSGLDLKASQGGTALEDGYLYSSYDYVWTDRQPGETADVAFAFVLANTTDDVTVTAMDWNHYADEVVFEATYTIADLEAAAASAPEELLEQLQ